MLNEILGVAARINSLLTRKFNITGGAPSPQLTPEVTPSFAIPLRPEDLAPFSERLFTGFVDVAPVALKTSVAQLANPAGSQQLVVIENITVQTLTGASGIYSGSLGNTATDLAQLPAAGGVIARDGRLNGSSLAHLTFDQSPPTIFAVNLFEVSQLVSLPFVFSVPLILAPGFQCQIVQRVAQNTELLVSFQWREVPLSPGELGPF
jgi:hypothetical protein